MNTMTRTSALLAIAVLFALNTACTKEKKPDPTTAETVPSEATDTVAGAPQIVEKPITADKAGSDSGDIPGLYTIHFEYDQARLTEDAKKQLSENAEWIKNSDSATIQIEGHTDSRGTVEYNLALGERRAKSVKAYLQGLGVDAKRLAIISYGEEVPLDSTETQTAWDKNRRANFVPQ